MKSFLRIFRCCIDDFVVTTVVISVLNSVVAPDVFVVEGGELVDSIVGA